MSLLGRIFGRNQQLSCAQVAAVLQHYLDDELEDAQVPKVLAHLEKCRECGLEAELYERIKASLRCHQQAPDQASLTRIRALATELAVSGPPEG